MPPLADINGLRHSGGAVGTPQFAGANFWVWAKPK